MLSCPASHSLLAMHTAVAILPQKALAGFRQYSLCALKFVPWLGAQQLSLCSDTLQASCGVFLYT